MKNIIILSLIFIVISLGFPKKGPQVTLKAPNNKSSTFAIWNIYYAAYHHYKDAEFTKKIEKIESAIIELNPDVVVLTEMSPEATIELNRRKKIPYNFVFDYGGMQGHVEEPESLYEGLTIAIKKSSSWSLKTWETGEYVYTNWLSEKTNDELGIKRTRVKGISSFFLTHKKMGNVIFIGLHFKASSFRDDKGFPESIRKKQSELLVKRINEIKTDVRTKDLPIFIGGDFNAFFDGESVFYVDQNRREEADKYIKRTLETVEILPITRDEEEWRSGKKIFSPHLSNLPDYTYVDDMVKEPVPKKWFTIIDYNEGKFDAAKAIDYLFIMQGKKLIKINKFGIYGKDNLPPDVNRFSDHVAVYINFW